VLACVSKRRDTVRVQRRRNCFALKRTKAFPSKNISSLTSVGGVLA
ncbi:MAG: hypothetical protein RIR45_544, partial [Pseudomonadota bacterium]